MSLKWVTAAENQVMFTSPAPNIIKDMFEKNYTNSGSKTGSQTHSDPSGIMFQSIGLGTQQNSTTNRMSPQEINDNSKRINKECFTNTCISSRTNATTTSSDSSSVSNSSNAMSRKQQQKSDKKKKDKDKKEKELAEALKLASDADQILLKPTEDRPIVYVVVEIIECVPVYLDYSIPSRPQLRMFLEEPELRAVDEGTGIYRIKEEHVGYYVTSTKTNERHLVRGLVASSFFSSVTLEPTFRDVGFTDLRKGKVFVPLLQALRHQFRAHTEKHEASTSHLAAIKNLVSKYKELCTTPLPENVIKYFFDVCDYTEAVYRLQVIGNHRSTTALHNPFLPAVISKYTSEVIHTRTIVVETVRDMPAHLAIPFPLKHGVLIKTKGKDFEPLKEENWFTNPPFPVIRTDVADEVPIEGRATHIWCKLAASTRYAASNYNLYWAMSRVFGARDGEEDYQRNQYLLTTVLINAYPHIIPHLSSMRVEVSMMPIPEEHTQKGVYDVFSDTFPCLPKNYYYTITKYPSIRKKDLISLSYPNLLIFINIYKPVISFFSIWIERMKPTVSEILIDFKDSAVRTVKMAAYTLYSSCTPAFLVRQDWSKVPHVKKLERERMVQASLVNSDKIHRDTVVKVKDELCKPGKKPRLFMSYGDAVVAAPWLPEIAKKHMHGWHFMTMGSLEVCIVAYTQPKTSELTELFDELVKAIVCTKDYLCVAFYSDDSCYAGCFHGVQFGFNVDISSCDSSNGVPIFYLVGALLHGIDSELSLQLIEQCTKPLTIPLEDGGKIQIDTGSVFEGSGAVVTTILNNVASAGIAVCVAKVLSAATLVTSRADIEKIIVQGAGLMGHKVTVASIEVAGVLQPAKFQFLKYSPMEAVHTTTGEVKLIPVRNFGTIIKSFGQLSEAMQARQLNMTVGAFRVLTVSQKFDLFLGGVVKGYCNEPKSPLLDALRSRFLDQTVVLDKGFVLVETDFDFSDYKVLESGQIARYGLLDYTEMTRVIQELQYGDIVTEHALETFMVVDYDAKYTRGETIDYSFTSHDYTR